MCGIFGYKNFNLNSNEIKSELFHRGPDDFGIINQDKWTFCHSRLSIIDTSDSAKQPMEYDGNIILFNGEIYNYKELVNEYLRGTSLKSSSDTEVLLVLISKYGLSILNKLNGMFAFAFYEKKTGSIFLVRDRFGVKPLYYYKSNNTIAFSSEDSVLMKILNLPYCVNYQYINNLINKEMSDFDEQTIHKDIFSVKAGEYIEITNDNKIIQTKYYTFNDFKIDKLENKDIVNYYEELLTDSIKLRNRSDVPIALTLSGGIDSSVIYILAREKLNTKYTLFTYSHDNIKLDEYPIAEKLAQEYNDKIIKIRYNPKSDIENFEKSLLALNAPIWSSAHAGYFEVYKTIKENGFKVVIEGHGADELFGGWPFMFPFAVKQAFANHNYLLGSQILNLYEKYNKISIKKKNKLDLLKIILPIKNTDKDVFIRILDYIFRERILPINLRCWDRIPMANSVESRSPFLDYRIVEFTRKLPLQYKINKYGNKAILRAILRKYKKEFIYNNEVKQPFLASEFDFIKNNHNYLLKYYDRNKFNYNISDWINNNFSNGYNPKIYKACALGFLASYYK